jgi:uncharacterized protein YycO
MNVNVNLPPIVSGPYTTQECPKDSGETARAAAANWALSKLGDPNYGLNGKIDNFGPGDYKCNKLPYDAYTKGALVPFPERKPGSPVSAADFANSNNIYNNFPIVTNLQSFDTLGFPPVRIHGHMAIYLSNDVIIQAGEFTVSTSSYTKALQEHNGQVTIRRYTP